MASCKINASRQSPAKTPRRQALCIQSASSKRLVEQQPWVNRWLPARSCWGTRDNRQVDGAPGTGRAALQARLPYLTTRQGISSNRSGFVAGQCRNDAAVYLFRIAQLVVALGLNGAPIAGDRTVLCIDIRIDEGTGSPAMAAAASRSKGTPCPQGHALEGTPVFVLAARSARPTARGRSRARLFAFVNFGERRLPDSRATLSSRPP